MSAPGDFVSRWSRLKREANSPRHVRPGVDARDVSVEPQTGPDTVQNRNGAAAIDPFDAASLPPIDAITSDTDISAFLRKEVPADLTRAALRKAWTSDPRIRNFIGIAEGQWEFNDANAIAGFGLLRPTDNPLAILEQAVGSCERAAEKVDEIADLHQSAQRKQDGPPTGEDCSRGTAEDSDPGGPASEHDRRAAGDTCSTRRHGSASPRVGRMSIG
jgi:hypothetical protein